MLDVVAAFVGGIFVGAGIFRFLSDALDRAAVKLVIEAIPAEHLADAAAHLRRKHGL